MGIRAIAGRTIFYFYNEGRTDVPSPPQFLNMDPSIGISYCVWVYLTNTIPVALLVHEGKDGSKVTITHDGSLWHINGQQGSVGIGSFGCAEVKINVWTCICVTQDSGYYNVFAGYEDLSVAQPWLVPVQLTYTTAAPFPITSTFDHIALVVNSTAAICCFKWWNVRLTQPEMQIQCHRWDTQTEGAGAAPIWACPMRTPGDTASIANPYAHTYWDQGHNWTAIDTSLTNLITAQDPQYMANQRPTPTWIYPTTFPSVFIDPGNTPATPTMYKGTQFFQFQDRGSVPTLDFQFQSILYYGSAFGGVDPGTVFTECWGLWKDENDVEVSNTTNPIYRFTPGDTAIEIPAGSGGAIKGSTLYSWKFGGQFLYPNTPAGPTNTAHLAYLLLYVTYIGYPTGVPTLDAKNLTGLFVIQKGALVDTYRYSVEIKIPNPTIRTAYIGE